MRAARAGRCPAGTPPASAAWTAVVTVAAILAALPLAGAAPAPASVDGVAVELREAASGPEKGNRYLRVEFRAVRGPGLDTSLEIRVRGRVWDERGASRSDEARIPGARLERLREGAERRLTAPLFRDSGVAGPSRVEIAIDLCQGDRVRHELARACWDAGTTRPGPCGAR